MTFLDLHNRVQAEIRLIEARKRKALALKAKQRGEWEAVKKGLVSGEIVGFADPVHDAIFKLFVTGVRLIKKHYQ